MKELLKKIWRKVFYFMYGDYSEGYVCFMLICYMVCLVSILLYLYFSLAIT